MSTPAGWFDDPTNPGRLRYWDGGSWTEWVSVNGQTVSEPIGAPMPAATGQPTGSGPIPEAVRQQVEPTPGIQAAPAAGGWGGFGETAGPGGAGPDDYPVQTLGRAGLGLAAIGGIVTAFAFDQEATRSTERFAGFDVDASVPIMGIIAAAVCVAGIFIKPWIVRVISLTVATGIFGFLAIALIATRTGDPFFAGEDIEIKTGWYIIAVGCILGMVGIVLGILGVVQARRTPASDGGPAKSSKGVASLVLSLLGLLIVPLATAGACVGQLGRRDAASSGGRIGSGLPTAGFVIGLLSVIGWAAGLLITAFVIMP